MSRWTRRTLNMDKRHHRPVQHLRLATKLVNRSRATVVNRWLRELMDNLWIKDHYNNKTLTLLTNNSRKFIPTVYNDPYLCIDNSSSHKWNLGSLAQIKFLDNIMKICLLLIDLKWFKRSTRHNGLESTLTTVAGQVPQQCAIKNVISSRLNNLLTKRSVLSDSWKYLTPSEILNLIFHFSFRLEMIGKVELSRISTKRIPRTWSKAFKICPVTFLQHLTRHSINKWT